MADAIGHGERAPDRSAAARWVAASANAARAAGPPLLFGLRLWASVCLALYVAFWLELDNASWAGTSAAKNVRFVRERPCRDCSSAGASSAAGTDHIGSP